MPVFRLRSEKNIPLTNSVDWFSSGSYTSNVIQGLADPDGGKGSEPTSVPSPFARMDLVKTAFKYVNEGYKEDTTFFKIVSDTLDVAEIFFNYEKYKKDLKIIEWDRNSHLKLLENSPNKEHKVLANSLKLYLDQDAISFNFNHVSKIFLLEYRAKIIGGTSPLTLFIPTGNNITDIDIEFPNGDKAFDTNYYPLYKREPDFQKMLFSLRASFDQFKALFTEFSKYMDMNLEELSKTNKSLYQDIHEIIDNKGENYTTSNYKHIENGVFIINGLPYYCAHNEINNLESGYEIDSKKYSGSKKPLVLKDKHNGLHIDGKTPLKYVRANYDPQLRVPHFSDEKILENRLLPGVTGIKYPFLVIGDFLEPYLIKTIYPINDTYFFNTIKQEKKEQLEHGYLLPLKEKYFEFFDTEDLNKLTIDGRPFFEMIVGRLGQVTIILRVPIVNNNYIQFERIYYPSQNEHIPTQPQEANNKGSIIELHFSLSLYPMVRLKKEELNYYRVGIFESDILPATKGVNYSLKFMKKAGESCMPVAAKKRNDKSYRNVNSLHYVINNKTFDYIKLDTGIGAKATIIPKFKEIQTGVKHSVFAIDFGTTYTHVEYTIKNVNDTPKTLDIQNEDIQIGYLNRNVENLMNGPDDKKRRALNRLLPNLRYETMPLTLGENSTYGFPTRTAISSSDKLNINEETYTLADLNIPFFYQKEPHYDAGSISIIRNLKWDSELEGNEKYIEHYFENLLFIIRNKAILNGCDLKKVKLVCSYPTSMLLYRRKQLEEKWELLFKKYFNANTEPKFISESLAPFYYLKKLGGISSLDKPVVSIDIGGETTDLVIYINDTPKVVSSVRFATNAVFGDGFNENINTNGFISYFSTQINRIIRDGNHKNLQILLKETESLTKSNDIVNAYFALESNMIYNPKSEVSFSKLLKNDSKFNIIYLLFYTSIAFHIAKLCKKLEIVTPGYITFSGMGSKILNFIDAGGMLKITKLIFKEILGDDNIEIVKSKIEPKVITSKGGVYFVEENESKQEDESIRKILLGDKELNIISNDEKKYTYNDIDDEVIESIADEFITFLALIGQIERYLDFKEYFGFTKNDYLKYIETLGKRTKVIEYIKHGIAAKHRQLNGDFNQRIEEPLFFYPLIGGLNKLAYMISNEN